MQNTTVMTTDACRRYLNTQLRIIIVGNGIMYQLILCRSKFTLDDYQTHQKKKKKKEVRNQVRHRMKLTGELHRCVDGFTVQNRK